MPLMQEALEKDIWEKKDRGERIPKPKVVSRPEPTFPKVENLIRFNDIPLTELDKVMNAKMRRIKNDEGYNFIGYDVTILLRGKRGPGRPKEGEESVDPPSRILKGWMIEGDYENLRRQR
jgi:hypothetical protein